MANGVTYANATLGMMDAQWQDMLGTFTSTNFPELGQVILGQTDLRNSFIDTAMNKVAVTLFQDKVFKNKLAFMKSGRITYGSLTEKITLQPAEGGKRDDTGQSLLKRVADNSIVEYFKENFNDSYQVTISTVELRKAFKSPQAFEQLINAKVAQLVTKAEIMEYSVTKKLITDSLPDLYECQLTESFASSPKELIKTLLNYQDYFEEPTTEFNTYEKAFPTAGQKCISYSRKEDLHIFMRTDVYSTLNVDVLATAFNLSKVEMAQRITTLPTLGDDNTLAILADSGKYVIQDINYDMESFYNASNRCHNYWLHVDQSFNISHTANAIKITDYVTP